MKRKVVIALVTSLTIGGVVTGCGNKGSLETEVVETVTVPEIASENPPGADSSVEEATEAELSLENETESEIPNPVISEVRTFPVKLPDDYAEVTYTKDNFTVTDEDIDAAIDNELAMTIEAQKITNRAVTDGDTISINFSGSINGTTDDSMMSEDEELTLGEGAFLEEFEKQIPGHMPGENFEVTVTFPDDYWQESFAGKTAVFKTVVNYIMEYSQTLELTDEWVKKHTDYDTVEEYRTYMKETLGQQSSTINDMHKESELIESLVSLSSVKIEEKDIQEELDVAMEEIKEHAKTSSYDDVAAYLEESFEMTVDEYKKEMSDSIMESAKRASVVEALIEKEGLKVSNDDFLKYLKEEIVPNYGFSSFDDFKKEMSEYGMMEYFDNLYKEHLVADFLDGKATAT